TPGGGRDLGNVVPAEPAVAGQLDALAGGQGAIAAGHHERGVAGDEVRGRAAGVVADGGDGQRRGGRTGVDGDVLAGGGADIAGGIDDPRRVSETGAVAGAGVVIAPGGRRRLG